MNKRFELNEEMMDEVIGGSCYCKKCLSKDTLWAMIKRGAKSIGDAVTSLF